jgi:hypothetical protein
MLSLFKRRHPHDLILGKSGISEVRIPAYQRAKHCHILGATGEGKSKLMEDMICQTIRSGLGVGCIDPHSSLIASVVKHLVTDGTFNEHQIKQRIIYIRPADERYVVPFNVLNSPETTYAIVANVLEGFKRTWTKALEESPRFDEIVTASLICLTENNLTLRQMRRFLTDKEYRDQCLERVSDTDVTEFFHKTYDQWGIREAAIYTQSTLNKISAFSFNPTLKIMLGQPDNVLDFRAIMDKRLILFLDLGSLPALTRRLLGGLVMRGLEDAMRRRENNELWSCFVDEFAQFVSNDGSAQTFEEILSEARKYGLALTVAHQKIGQLPESTLSGLGNTYHKIVFSVDWNDAEFMSKTIGRVKSTKVKQDAKTVTQQDQLQSYSEQWEDVAETLRSQQERWAHVATRKQAGRAFKTRTLPKYTAGQQELENLWIESMQQFGIPYEQAKANIDQFHQEVQGEQKSSAYIKE